MDGTKFQAIVLNSKDSKEADRVVTLLTLEQGKIVATLKGVQKPKAKLAFASQPFCFGEFLLVEKSGYYTVTGATATDSFFAVLQDFEKYCVGAIMLECMSIVSKEGDPQSGLFVLLLKALKTLAYEKTDTQLVCAKYLMLLLDAIGYSYDFSHCIMCGTAPSNHVYFSLEAGGIVCEKCAGGLGHKMPDGLLDLLQKIEKTDFEDLEDLVCDPKNVQTSRDLLITCFEAKTDERLNSKICL